MSMQGMGRRKMINGDEYDAYTRWRKYLCYLGKAGAVKSIKKRTHKRERQQGRREASGE